MLRLLLKNIYHKWYVRREHMFNKNKYYILRLKKIAIIFDNYIYHK